MNKNIFFCIIGAVIGAICAVLVFSTISLRAPKCFDGAAPDANGCCGGEEYTIINGTPACCPDGDGDCFEPILK